MTYPQTPGWRPNSASTSKDAAMKVRPRAPAMILRVEDHLRAHGPASPEEITDAIAGPGERLLLTSIRARVCQLHKLGRVVDSGERGIGESLRAKVIKWRLATPEERALFIARKTSAAETKEGAQ